MQTRKILAALAVVVGSILAGCTSTNTLNGTSWVLVNVNGQSVMSGPLVTNNFANGKISGTDGCNSYSTSYLVNGDEISFSKHIATTMMACPPPIMQQAVAYITALTEAATYKINGRQLALLDASGKTLATFVSPSSELGGTSWIVRDYNNGKQGVVGVVVGSELTADFSADGKVSGSAGCNKYTAAYEASGKNIKIDRVAYTREMCADPAGVMEQETEYLKALGTVATYCLDGNQLELRTATGALAVGFARTGTAVTLLTRTSQKGASTLQALPKARAERSTDDMNNTPS